MIAAWVVAFASVSSGPTTIMPPVEGFDLAKVPVREASCTEAGRPDEIIVCAPKNMDIWLADIGAFDTKPFTSGFTGPLNAETIVHVIQHETPVATVPAAAVTLKWRF
jgi:hypothetical protein